jgi:plasmid stabilization system protein ParE
MTHPIVMRRQARAEYDAAVDWYNKKQAGLGLRFIRTVETVLELISDKPLLYRQVLRDIRQAVVSGYPYCIYYRVRRSAVAVLSVFHTSRDPSVWQSRT